MAERTCVFVVSEDIDFAFENFRKKQIQKRGNFGRYQHLTLDQFKKAFTEKLLCHQAMVNDLTSRVSFRHLTVFAEHGLEQNAEKLRTFLLERS